MLMLMIVVMPVPLPLQEDGFTLPKLYVWDVEQDTLSYYNFETGMNEFDDCAARAAAVAAAGQLAQATGEQQRPDTAASGVLNSKSKPSTPAPAASPARSDPKSSLKATGSASDMGDTCARPSLSLRSTGCMS